MKHCSRCNERAKSKILTACGLIRLCNHCRRVWWSIFTQRDELTGIGP